MYTPKLIVLSGANRGQIYELEGSKITCGRAKQCSICIPDGTVSSLHCSFYEQDGKWFVVDEGSSNGTRVNNIPIESKELEYMDILQIGSEELMFNIDNAEATTSIIKTTTGIDFKPIKGLSTMKNASPFYKPFSGKKQNKVIGIIISILILIVTILLAWLGWFVFYQGEF